MRIRTAAGWGCALVLLVALTGCSGGSDEPVPAATLSTPVSSTSSAPAQYPSSVATEALTEPGSELSYGQGASVAWQATADVVGTLRISVGSVERTTFKKSFKDWKVDETTKTYTPYFVHAYLANLGDTDLSGLAVPLYAESSADALVEASTFATTFEACDPGALPEGFTAGVTTSVCLVYLVPPGGELTGVVFRPTEEFVPITWSGAIRTLAPTS